MGVLTAALAAVLMAQGGSASARGGEVFIGRALDAATDQYEPVLGEASLEVEGRQSATFTATVRDGVDRWELELVQVGEARQDEVVFGHTGLGVPRMPLARAALAVAGALRVTFNGAVVEEAAPGQIFALATGVHADDQTNRRLPAARAGDTELIVYLPLIRAEVPGRYLLLVFENPRIEVAGREVRSVLEVPVTQAQLPTAIPPMVAELESVPPLPPPDFAGAEAEEGLRIPATALALPLLQSVEPSTAEPALPLGDRGPIIVGALPEPERLSATLLAVPLPEGVPPLATRGAPGEPAELPPLPPPAGAAPAIPLPEGVPPANLVPFSAQLPERPGFERFIEPGVLGPPAPADRSFGGGAGELAAPPGAPGVQAPGFLPTPPPLGTTPIPGSSPAVPLEPGFAPAPPT